VVGRNDVQSTESRYQHKKELRGRLNRNLLSLLSTARQRRLQSSLALGPIWTAPTMDVVEIDSPCSSDLYAHSLRVMIGGWTYRAHSECGELSRLSLSC
jgi:hypothetical protein